MRYLIALPAYGRDYSNPLDIVKDWEEGKDFKILKGPYFSIRDEEKIKEDEYWCVLFIYNKMQYNYAHWLVNPRIHYGIK